MKKIGLVENELTGEKEYKEVKSETEILTSRIRKLEKNQREKDKMIDELIEIIENLKEEIKLINK